MVQSLKNTRKLTIIDAAVVQENTIDETVVEIFACLRQASTMART